MIEVSRLEDLNAAKLFRGFRIGAISRRDFAVFPIQGQRGLRRLKRYFGDKMSVGAQMVIVLKAFVERCVSLVLGHPFEFSRRDVSQTDVFHRSLLLVRFLWGGSQQHSLARWVVHPLDRSSYSRRERRKSTTGANDFYSAKKMGRNWGRTGYFPFFWTGNRGTFRLSPGFVPRFPDRSSSRPFIL